MFVRIVVVINEGFLGRVFFFYSYFVYLSMVGIVFVDLVVCLFLASIKKEGMVNLVISEG